VFYTLDLKGENANKHLRIKLPLLYPLKRVLSNPNLFVALLIGVFLASTFFAAINIKANLAAEQALSQQLKNVKSDLEFNANMNSTGIAYAVSNISSIAGVKGVDVVIRSSPYPFLNITFDDNQSMISRLPMVCFLNTSQAINNEWLNKPSEGIAENQTYIILGQVLKDKVDIGDNISASLDFFSSKYYNYTSIKFNLTVAGFADFTEKGYSMISGTYYYPTSFTPSSSSQRYNYKQDLLIISKENTYDKLYANLSYTTFSASFLISLDHDALLTPWDTTASAKNVQMVADNIQNKVLENLEVMGNVQNNLGNVLTIFYSSFESTLLSYLLISIPVLFIAWYLGSTVSDVSFNMRRREIGLLSTKGLSSGQIQRMFFTESLVIGLFGGLLGVIGGLILNQAFIGEVTINTIFNPQLFSYSTMIFTVVFGVILSFTAVFFSARRASKIPAVDALRNYVDTDVYKTTKKVLPIISFVLGTYKIVAFALGINVISLLSSFVMSGGFYLSIILYPLSLLDSFLTYFGPLLFLWGLIKLLIQCSSKFQQFTSKITSVGGELGHLAAKNIRRNPARIAAIAFIVAFIIAYGVQVSGQLASEKDYIIRRIQYDVGADVTVSVINATKADLILNDILANVSGIKNTTMECELEQNKANTFMRTIDPDSWLVTAYHENDWFSGVSMQDAFNSLKEDNMTIILERRVAKQLNKNIGDTIGIDFPSGGRKLTIVGFYGPEPIEMSTRVMTTAIGPSSYFSFVDQAWSYIPRNVFNMSSPYSDAYQLENFDVRILLKLEKGVNGTAVAEKIRSLDLEIYGVSSFDEQWTISQQGNNQYTASSLQTLDIQQLGLIFVVLSASVGTGLIAVVSLRERSREATLMSVRGLSYRQLVRMFLTENIIVITFSVILGLTVGLIIVYGNITSTNSVLNVLVERRLLFSTDFINTIAAYVFMVYAAAILPVLITTWSYVTKLERMVRVK